MYARLLSLSLLAIVLLSAFVSCSYTNDQPVLAPIQGSESEEWTVLFYGAGTTPADITDDAQSSVLATFESMQRVYAVSSVNVIACISSGLSGGATRIYVLPSNADDPASPEISGYVDWGYRDMSSPQTLAEFIAYGTAQFPASKMALVIMGEGDGWRGVVRDDVNGGGALMSLSGFRQAVMSSIDHLDLIAWLVPGMNSIEVAYECGALADYMVGCAWPLAHDVTLSPRVWLTDLMQNPAMNAERLGMMMVDGLYESAHEENDSVNYALLQLSNISALVPEIDSLAMALTPYSENNTLELPALWNAAWVAQTDDSQSVDVGRLTAEVLDEPLLASDPMVSGAAQHVIASLEELVIYRRTTLAGEDRFGVSIYLPYSLDTTVLASYGELSLSSDHPGWYTLLNATAANAPVVTTLAGTVRWTNHVLENVRVFLNIAQSGSPNIAGSEPASIVEVISQDYVRYSALLTVEDSLACYLGLFQDLDHSGSLTAGDRYGYYHQNPSPPRDWIILREGDQLVNINVELDRTF